MANTSVTSGVSTAGTVSGTSVHGPNDISDFNIPSATRTLIEENAAKYNVPPRLIASVMKQESGFHPNARSWCGAEGLMQLMPATARSLGVSDPCDPAQAVEGGTKLLSGLLNKYGGNIPLALAAYNAGPGNVAKAGGKVPQIPETLNYVASITKTYNGQVPAGLTIPSTATYVNAATGKSTTSSFSSLSHFFDNLDFLSYFEAGQTFSQVCDEVQKNIEQQSGGKVDQAVVEQYLKTHYPQLAGGVVPAPGITIHIPHVEPSSHDRFQLEEAPPYELQPRPPAEKAQPPPVVDEALIKQVQTLRPPVAA
jgi:hypothetical protein